MNLISNITICPREIIAPWNYGMMIVAFDYPIIVNMRIDITKWYGFFEYDDTKRTTHFREMYSMDMICRDEIYGEYKIDTWIFSFN